MQISIIMKKEQLKQKHIDYAKEWYDKDEEGVYWLSEDTDMWKEEECYFDHVEGDFTISLVTDSGFYVSIKVPLKRMIEAINKVNLPSIIKTQIQKAKDAKEQMEQIH